MEDGLADEPQETVHASPELGGVRQAHGAVGKEVDFTDDVAEAQNQTAADEGGNDGGENLAQSAHRPLNEGLVGLGGGLHSVLAHPFHSGVGGELLVEYRNVVADDDLELSGLGEGAFHGGNFLNFGHICLAGVSQHEPHPGHAVGDGLDVLPSADEWQQRLYVSLILGHMPILLLFSHGSLVCSGPRLPVPLLILTIHHLFKQVNLAKVINIDLHF